LEGLDFIVIVRKVINCSALTTRRACDVFPQGSFARAWDIVSQCDGRFMVSGEFPFKGQFSVEVTTPDLQTHALGSPFLVPLLPYHFLFLLVLCGRPARHLTHFFAGYGD
jgi:hypothetical protein